MYNNYNKLIKYLYINKIYNTNERREIIYLYDDVRYILIIYKIINTKLILNINVYM